MRLSNGWFVTAASVLALAGLGVLLWCPWDRPAVSGPHLRLFCAAGMTQPVTEIIHDYQQRYGASVEPTFGGSGELLAMITALASPGDLFLSADGFHMEQAEKAGLISETIPVAVHSPVLVVNARSQQQLRQQGQPVAGLADLLRDDLQVVLADDARASIGRVTRKVLEPLGLWEQLEKRRRAAGASLLTVPTVNQVALTVRTKDHYVGVVWNEVAAQFAELEVVPVAEFLNVTEHITIGVLARSRQPKAALQFARYLTASERSREVLRQFHFSPVPYGFQ